MHDPDYIFRVAVSSKVEEKYFQHRHDAYNYAREETANQVSYVVANVYVKDGKNWEHIAQYRNGIKVF